MKIGLLSDTHGFLDPQIPELLSECDEVWHAGDIGSPDLLEVFEERGQVLRAVYGNIDGSEIRLRYPEQQIFIVGGLKVWIKHIGGYPPRYTLDIRKQLDEIRPRIFICGHSHILKVIPDKERELLHLNPGAAGRHGFHKVRTLLTFEIVESKVQSLNVVELGQRSKIH